MPASQSLMTTRRGEFRTLYRALARKPAAFASTPIVFCEGDSWFSTPLAMNLLDWLVFPAPEDEKKGVPLFGAGGLFFRTEDSGDLALDMFTARGIRDLSTWYRGFAFDLVLVSAGGNDFVDDFLQSTFRGAAPMSPEAAHQRVVATGRYTEVLARYHAFVTAFQAIRPHTLILAHTYDYPRELVPEGETPASWLAALTRDGAALRWPGGVRASSISRGRSTRSTRATRRISRIEMLPSPASSWAR